MGDGTRLNKGEGGDLILTDEVGAFKVEVAKVGFGPDGELVLVSSANPLPAIDSAAITKLAEILTALGATLKAEVLTEPATKADGGAGLPAVVKVVGGYDGTNVQAFVTDSAGVQKVSLEASSAEVGTVKLTGEPKVKVAELPATPTGTNSIGKIKSLEEALPAGNNNIGDVDVASIAAGSAKIGDVGIGTRTSGGCLMNKNLDVDESEDAVKETAGQVYGFYFFNAAAVVQYLKYYNATPANVTVGTTVPDLTFPLPKEAAGTINLPCPVAFGTAITIAATTGLADNNAGAPATNSVIVDTFYA
jgi:hypothetical protein